MGLVLTPPRCLICSTADSSFDLTENSVKLVECGELWVSGNIEAAVVEKQKYGHAYANCDRHST